MKHHLLYILLILVLTVGCKSTVRRDTSSRTPSYHFQRVRPPEHLTARERAAYMREHYWDNFDFADTVFIANADTTEMLRVYANFAANLTESADGEAIKRVMERASTSKPMFEYFVMLAERVLHDPNSPLRNDELYIPVLEAQLSTPFYDEYERMAPRYDLDIAMQNRIGRPANDFRYTLSSGRSANLYSINAEYLLIYINNPECSMCKSVQADIAGSELLGRLQRNGELAILAIYPDEDLAAWREYAATMPAEWINSYDKGCVIREKGLYDLKAIPSLYLLDARKRVIVKDSTSVGEIEFAIASTYDESK